MKRLFDGAGYKYLGILLEGQLRRVRKVLETKLKGGNIIKGINTWLVSLVRYSAGFID